MKYIVLLLVVLCASCSDRPKSNEKVAKNLCFDRMNTGEFRIKKTNTFEEADHWRFVYSIEKNGVPDFRRCTISKTDSRLPSPVKVADKTKFTTDDIPSDYQNRPAIASSLNELTKKVSSCRNVDPASIAQWSQASGNHRKNEIGYWVMCGGEQTTFFASK